MRAAYTLRMRRCSRGFTLIELIISVILLGILAASGSSMFSDTFTLTRMVDSRQRNADQARYAIERLAREVREVKYDELTGNYSIGSVVSSVNSMTFTNSANQAVAVAVTGGNLTLSYGTASVLASNVSSFTINFKQIGSTNIPATTVANVRFVELLLTLVDPTSGQSTTERVRVSLRNG